MQVVAATRTPDLAGATASRHCGHPRAGSPGPLLGLSGFVFLCPPLTQEARYIIDAATLPAMRPEAFLINTGRGGLMDQSALLHAIEARQIAGAGLGVFTPESLSLASRLLERAEILAPPPTSRG